MNFINNQVQENVSEPPLDQEVWGGDQITNPKFRKTSRSFKYYEDLSDSDCSEDYDDDVFFDGNNPQVHQCLSQH